MNKHEIYCSVRSWIVSNWAFSNQTIAMLALDHLLSEGKRDITEIKQGILDFVKKQNGGFSLVSV